MTDQTPADLIAEAQTCVTDEYITPDTPFEESLIRRLAAALKASEKRAEEAKRERDALASAPADALRDLRADAWDEGYRSGYIEGQADAHRLDPDDIEETPNPYADSPRHNGPQRREEQS